MPEMTRGAQRFDARSQGRFPAGLTMIVARLPVLAHSWSGSANGRGTIERRGLPRPAGVFGARSRPTDSSGRRGLPGDRRTSARLVGLREPSALVEPAAQRAGGGAPDPPRLAVPREVVTDLHGGLAGGESPFGLASEVRPCVRPGAVSRPGAAHPTQVGAHRSGMATIRDTCRPPHGCEARNEVAAPTAPLEGVAAVRFAEPDRHAVSEALLTTRAVARATTDRAHRKLPDPRPLVVADRHGLMLSRIDVTPLTSIVKRRCRDRSNSLHQSGCRDTDGVSRPVGRCIGGQVAAVDTPGARTNAPGCAMGRPRGRQRGCRFLRRLRRCPGHLAADAVANWPAAVPGLLVPNACRCRSGHSPR